VVPHADDDPGGGDRVAGSQGLGVCGPQVVAGDELNEPFAATVYARREWSLAASVETVERQRGVLIENAAPELPTSADLLLTALEGQCSSKTAMVELRGFEPLTPSYRQSRSLACR
jgi:hypothetical protein